MTKDYLAESRGPRAEEPVLWPSTKSLVCQARDIRGQLEDLCGQLRDLRNELRGIGVALWMLLILMMYATAGVLGIVFHVSLS